MHERNIKGPDAPNDPDEQDTPETERTEENDRPGDNPPQDPAQGNPPGA